MPTRPSVEFVRQVSLLYGLLAVTSLAFAIPAVAQEPEPAFSFEVIDAQGAGTASIAIDRNGAPHVGYVDITRSKFRHPHPTETGWIIEDAPDATTLNCHFTLSAHGEPFFLFNYGTSAVRYESGWFVSGLMGCTQPAFVFAL